MPEGEDRFLVTVFNEMSKYWDTSPIFTLSIPRANLIPVIDV